MDWVDWGYVGYFLGGFGISWAVRSMAEEWNKQKQDKTNGLLTIDNSHGDSRIIKELALKFGINEYAAQAKFEALKERFYELSPGQLFTHIMTGEINFMRAGIKEIRK
jgi:hypothetical protein